MDTDDPAKLQYYRQQIFANASAILDASVVDLATWRWRGPDDNYSYRAALVEKGTGSMIIKTPDDGTVSRGKELENLLAETEDYIDRRIRSDELGLRILALDEHDGHDT